MTLRRILLAVRFAGSAAAQTLIQMSDLQFGMSTSNVGFAHETVELRVRDREPWLKKRESPPAEMPTVSTRRRIHSERQQSFRNGVNGETGRPTHWTSDRQYTQPQLVQYAARLPP